MSANAVGDALRPPPEHGGHTPRVHCPDAEADAISKALQGRRAGDPGAGFVADHADMTRGKAAGADFHSIARLTYYVVNYQPSHLQVIRSVRDRFVNLEKPPASTLIGVAALALPGLLVEIDAIAVVQQTDVDR